MTDQNPSPSVFKFAVWMIGSLIGALLVLDENVAAGSMAIFSGGPLSPNFAIAITVLLCVGMGISIPIYHRAVDDQEERE